MDAQGSKIRVLRIIARMNVGGPALQIFGISSHLDTREFEQILITGYCEETELDFLVEHEVPIPVIRVPGFGRKIGVLSDLQAFISIRKIIRDFRPHIVHTHTAKAGVLGRIASITSFKKQKRVHTFHGHLLHGYFSPLITKIVIHVERALAKKTHMLISVGEQVRDDLLEQKIGVFEKFRVIPPGLELHIDTSKEKARSDLGLSASSTYFAWIGRVVPIKDPLRLVSLATIVKNENSNIRFVVAGDGPLKDELQRIAMDKHLPIDFLGWQPEIENVLAACDAVILTSLNEGTPLSLIQAQMSGKPVISTNVGSISEIVDVGVSGFVGDFDDKSMASLILKLSEDETLRESMGRAGAEYATKKYSVQRLASDHKDAYRYLLN